MISDVYKNVKALLASKYPTLKVYDPSISEGMKKPCFFIEVGNQADERATINFKEREYLATITYLQKDKDGEDNYTKIDEIDTLFGLKLGTANVRDYRHQFVGEDGNILQIEVELNETQWLDHTDTQPTMNKLNINKEV